MCKFGLKVYGTDGPSRLSNVVSVPLAPPTIKVHDDKDDDEGLGFKDIAEIVFGTIGALTTIVTTVGAYIKCKRSKQNGESGTGDPESENRSGMLLRTILFTVSS